MKTLPAAKLTKATHDLILYQIILQKIYQARKKAVPQKQKRKAVTLSR
ncbi:MAG TPA: hypothetical protein VG842_09335 [Sediminibacterium sp.]|nr:hypothetical protein [Sediminibacterium sp.]